MAVRQKYTVIVPFPTGGGHWSSVGAELNLLDVQAHALVTAGRLRLTSELQAEAAASATKTTKNTTAKAE